jgi:hypothetical protein
VRDPDPTPTDGIRRTYDPTPTGGAPRTGPARGFQQRWGPPVALLVGLLAAAAVAGVVLWQAMVGDDGDGGAAVVPSTVAVVDTTVAGGTTPVTLGSGDELGDLRLSSFDPLGDDGLENEDQVGLATDGELATAWQTLCYSNRYLGATGGVGLVVELPGAGAGVVELALAALPWNVELYQAAELPSTLEGWGPPVDKAFSTSARETTLTFSGTDTRYLLVFLRELGRDPGCSEANPFRGGISELTVRSA